jgi:hypothetical protein
VVPDAKPCVNTRNRTEVRFVVDTAPVSGLNVPAVCPMAARGFVVNEGMGRDSSEGSWPIL